MSFIRQREACRRANQPRTTTLPDQWNPYGRFASGSLALSLLLSCLVEPQCAVAGSSTLAISPEYLPIPPVAPPKTVSSPLAPVAGVEPDPTSDAVNPLNSEPVVNDGRPKNGLPRPAWTSGQGQRIGQHVFYQPHPGGWRPPAGSGEASDPMMSESPPTPGPPPPPDPSGQNGQDGPADEFPPDVVAWAKGLGAEPGGPSAQKPPFDWIALYLQVGAVGGLLGAIGVTLIVWRWLSGRFGALGLALGGFAGAALGFATFWAMFWAWPLTPIVLVVLLAPHRKAAAWRHAPGR